MPTCRLCNSSRISPRFMGQSDYLFRAEGKWDVYECGVCRSFQMVPLPTLQQIEGFYSGYYTHGTEARERDGWRRKVSRRLHLAWTRGAGQARFVDRVVRLALWLPMQRLGRQYAFMREPAKGERILDYGCGSGDLVAKLRALGFDCEGVDFDGVAVSRARALGIKVQHLVEFEPRVRCYDRIFLLNVLEHVPDPMQLLKSLTPLLETNGTVVIETPNATSLLARLFGARWRGHEIPRHLHLFSREGLSRVLSAAGYGRPLDSRFVPCAGFFINTSRLPFAVRAFLMVLAPVIDALELCIPRLREVFYLTVAPVVQGQEPTRQRGGLP